MTSLTRGFHMPPAMRTRARIAITANKIEAAIDNFLKRGFIHSELRHKKPRSFDSGFPRRRVRAGSSLAQDDRINIDDSININELVTAPPSLQSEIFVPR